MQIELLHRPGNTAAKVTLQPNEHFTAEGGSMIAMSGDMQIETTTMKKGSGGLLKAAKRLLSGESFFLNHYTAGAGGGEVFLATALAGDMMEYDLNNETLIVQSGSYVASEPNVDIDTGWQGFKSFFSGESVFWVKLSGQGKVLLNSFGTIYPIQLNGAHIVDTGHIVAFNETLDFKLSKAGKSWLSSILGGEGLVCRFEGQGTVWCQSHNASGFGKVLGPNLRPR